MAGLHKKSILSNLITSAQRTPTIQPLNTIPPISLHTHLIMRNSCSLPFLQKPLLLCLSGLLLLTACRTDTDKDGIDNKIDKCPTVAAKTKDGCPTPDRPIAAVHFYLETSASMGGYFKGQEFKNIVTDLTGKIDKQIDHSKPLDIWYTSDQTTRFNGSAQDFSSAIATVKIAPGKSSQLHNILKNIAAKNGRDDISLLVSDCILSFPDADIKANREINAQSASSTLKGNIYNTFADLKKKRTAASIYAFRSAFNGTYYDYQNTKKVLIGQQRPFYVWVIGDSSLLRKFNNQLADISSFKPAESMHFGLSGGSVGSYDIISQLRPKGSGAWMRERDGVADIELSKTSGTDIPVAVNLSSLPPYAQKIAYLNEHLQIKAEGATATITALDAKTIDKSRVTSEPQKLSLEGATHILMVHLSAMNLKDGEISISLPAEAPVWHRAWSCMDDRNLAATCANKTFALEYLIQGVQEAYEEKSANYFNINFHLSK